MHERFCGITIVRNQRWQGAKDFRPEPLIRFLAGLAMAAPIGDFVQPLAGLRVDIGQIAE